MNFVISDELFEHKEEGKLKKYVLLITSSVDMSVKMVGLKLENFELCTSNPPQI